MPEMGSRPRPICGKAQAGIYSCCAASVRKFVAPQIAMWESPKIKTWVLLVVFMLAGLAFTSFIVERF